MEWDEHVRFSFQYLSFLRISVSGSHKYPHIGGGLLGNRACHVQ